MFNALMNSSRKRLRHWQTDNFSSLGQTLSTWPFEISDKFEACRHGSCCSVTEKSFLFFQKKFKFPVIRLARPTVPNAQSVK